MMNFNDARSEVHKFISVGFGGVSIVSRRIFMHLDYLHFLRSHLAGGTVTELLGCSRSKRLLALLSGQPRPDSTLRPSDHLHLHLGHFAFLLHFWAI